MPGKFNKKPKQKTADSEKKKTQSKKREADTEKNEQKKFQKLNRLELLTIICRQKEEYEILKKNYEAEITSVKECYECQLNELREEAVRLRKENSRVNAIIETARDAAAAYIGDIKLKSGERNIGSCGCTSAAKKSVGKDFTSQTLSQNNPDKLNKSRNCNCTQAQSSCSEIRTVIVKSAGKSEKRK